MPRPKFTEYEADDETGLNFAQARFQSSVQGRFTSADPLSGNPHRPQSWNRYAYVVNNPLKLIDPSGMSAVRSTDDVSTDVRANGVGALSLGESWTRDEALEAAAESTAEDAISGAAGLVPAAGVDSQKPLISDNKPGVCSIELLIGGPLSPGNKLSFPGDNQGLGPTEDSFGWFWQVEVRGTVAGDASKWFLGQRSSSSTRGQERDMLLGRIFNEMR
jgi:RHS repeat-associated protein